MQSLLFEPRATDLPLNVLPRDGSAHYYPKVFEESRCIEVMDQLRNSLTFEIDQLVMFGKAVSTRRKVAWVADAGCTYKYSGVLKMPQAWTSDLLIIKEELEAISRCQFNSCLLNFYHDGDDGMGWHSDDEKELDPHAPIASLSLGARRKFAFRHKKDKETISLFLENGSALIMHAPTQQFWHHALLKTKTISEARINLTFRKINPRDE
jgi:alkylated DNA repair dioxygenase AlkB